MLQESIDLLRKLVSIRSFSGEEKSGATFAPIFSRKE